MSELARRPTVPVQAPPTPPAPAPPEAVSPPPPAQKKAAALERQLAGLVGRIPEHLQKGALHILIELRHLLTHLDLIEGGIKQEKDPQKIVPLFGPIYDRASTLAGKTKSLAGQAGAGEEALRLALEGISFALKHELGRVFEGEAPSLKGAARAPLSRSELTRFYGLLHNCFQQSTIALAQAFDPTLDGEAIFEDYRIKQEQSIILRKELTLLLQKIRRLEEGSGILRTLYFINSLKQFQVETMQFLMHRDWEEFEGFVEEIVKTYDDMGDLAPVFHRFASYLETLLRHVGMRAVLSGRPFGAAEKTTGAV